MRTHYETPTALRHDAQTLAADARALISATSDIADEKVASARRRFEAALSEGRDLLDRAQEQASNHIQATDQCVRRYPYESIGVAFGVGAILGYLLNRR
ncbi:MAG: DUF883 family protein [Verrucomicrobiales bacterium]|nr:DUF883 family protein [Verrucomicrobiales bacterium]